MPANLETPVPAASESAGLTRVQKLAVLLFMLGPESAAEVLKHFDEKEIDAISAEMVRFDFVSEDLQAEILREFAEVAERAGGAVSGGPDFVRDALELAVGRTRATRIVQRAGHSTPSSQLRPLLDADPRELFSLVSGEQPQTIALLASHLPPDKASRLLGCCPAGLRDRVVERLATLAPTPIEVVERIAAVLNRRLADRAVRAFSQTGGVKNTAALLNGLGREVSDAMLNAIEQRNPDLGKAIRRKMLLFEDLGQIESSALQRILREVDVNDLTLALKKAPEALKNTMLGCISKRAAEAVREEMSFLASAKMRDVEAARLRIIDVARRLETEGEIELNPGEEESEDESAT